MADNTTKIISELDYESIRNSIAKFIANNSDFTDYNFEGSALSFLMDVLAYNTHYNAVYLNLALNESFIDTAQVRSSVVSLAKNLGYTPRSATSAQAQLSFVMPAIVVSPLDVSILNLLVLRTKSPLTIKLLFKLASPPTIKNVPTLTVLFDE